MAPRLKPWWNVWRPAAAYTLYLQLVRFWQSTFAAGSEHKNEYRIVFSLLECMLLTNHGSWLGHLPRNNGADMKRVHITAFAHMAHKDCMLFEVHVPYCFYGCWHMPRLKGAQKDLVWLLCGLGVNAPPTRAHSHVCCKACNYDSICNMFVFMMSFESLATWWHGPALPSPAPEGSEPVVCAAAVAITNFVSNPDSFTDRGIQSRISLNWAVTENLICTAHALHIDFVRVFIEYFLRSGPSRKLRMAIVCLEEHIQSQLRNRFNPDLWNLEFGQIW